MANKLFKDTSSQSWTSNACVGGPFTDGFTYAIGYYDAAKVLVDEAISKDQNHLKDVLFYPICFNYRHFVEILLKELIVVTENFYKNTKKLGYEKKKLTKSISDNLKKNHSIQSLLQLLLEGLECVSNETFSQDIKDILVELHNLDPSGQIFRYAMTTQEKPSFKDQQYFDLVFLKQKMEEVHNYLSGIDGWLDHHDKMANAMIEDLNSAYQNR